MFEYVASGLSFLRVRFAESHKSPTKFMQTLVVCK